MSNTLAHYRNNLYQIINTLITTDAEDEAYQALCEGFCEISDLYQAKLRELDTLKPAETE